jgi:mRNA interferase MazF
LCHFLFLTCHRRSLRPALVLAPAGRGDWILCQITSNSYGDANSIELRDENFQTGALRVTSYARPGKLFTASDSLIVGQVGNLKAEALKRIIEAVIDILQSNLSTLETKFLVFLQ